MSGKDDAAWIAGALRSNAVAIESQRISPRRIVDGVLLPTTAADATHMQLIE